MTGTPPISRSSPLSMGVDLTAVAPNRPAAGAGSAGPSALPSKRGRPGSFDGTIRPAKLGVLPPSAAAGFVADPCATATYDEARPASGARREEWCWYTDPVRQRPAGLLTNGRVAPEVAREVDFAETFLETAPSKLDRHVVLKLATELRYRGLTLDVASRQAEAFEAFLTLGKDSLGLDQTVRAAAARYGFRDARRRTVGTAPRRDASSLPDWARARFECQPPMTIQQSDVEALPQADQDALATIDANNQSSRSIVCRFLVALHRHGASLEVARADPVSASHLLDSALRDEWLHARTISKVNHHLALGLVRLRSDESGGGAVAPATPQPVEPELWLNDVLWGDIPSLEPGSPSNFAGMVGADTIGPSFEVAGPATDSRLPGLDEPGLPNVVERAGEPGPSVEPLPWWSANTARERPRQRLKQSKVPPEVAFEVDLVLREAGRLANVRERGVLQHVAHELWWRGTRLSAARRLSGAFRHFLDVGIESFGLPAITRTVLHDFGVYDAPVRSIARIPRRPEAELAPWARSRPREELPADLTVRDLPESERLALSAIDGYAMRLIVERFLIALARHGGTLELARSDPSSTSQMVDRGERERWLSGDTRPALNRFLKLGLSKVENDAPGEPVVSDMELGQASPSEAEPPSR